MKILGIAAAFLLGGFSGICVMCLAQSSGAASRAEGKELERIENERIRQNNSQP